MTTENNNDIIKKCIINHLPIPTEIQYCIKDFVFNDPVTSKSKKQKKLLSDSLKRNLIYLEPEPFTGHWATIFERTQLQAVNCMLCGDFIFANSYIGTGLQCRCII